MLHIESHIPAWDVTGSWEGSAEQRYDRKFVQSFSRYRKQLASSNGADETKHETKHAEGKSRAVKSKRKLIPVSSPAAAVAQAESAPVSAAASAASSLPSPFQASAVDSSFVADDSSAPSVNRSPVASVPAVAVVAPAQPASMPSLVSQPGAVGQEVQVVAVAPIAAFAANAELVAGPAAMAAPKADEALMMSSSPSESSAHGAAALDRASNAPSVPALAAQPSQPASVSAPVPDSLQSLSIPVAPPVVAGALMAKVSMFRKCQCRLALLCCVSCMFRHPTPEAKAAAQPVSRSRFRFVPARPWYQCLRPDALVQMNRSQSMFRSDPCNNSCRIVGNVW